MASSSRDLPDRRLTGREILIRPFSRIFVALVLTSALLYLGDYLVLRYRVATRWHPYETVTVHPYYAVPKKNRSTEFLFDQPHDEQCVNSLFPHLDHSTCWYLTRHKERRIDM
jgi:hypothetical protein